MSSMIKGVNPHLGPDTGAILVYCGRKIRKKAITALQSEATNAYGPPPTYSRTERPMEREIDGKPAHIVVFEDVPPGRVWVSTQERDHWNRISREVSIYPNEVTEIELG